MLQNPKGAGVAVAAASNTRINDAATLSASVRDAHLVLGIPSSMVSPRPGVISLRRRLSTWC
jgi:hypothetical protein